jgi:hypothetical protein
MADSDPIQPAVVWLSPWCETCRKTEGWSGEGQLWCTAPQDDCPECGLGWTRYTLDTAQASTVRPKPEPNDE